MSPRAWEACDRYIPSPWGLARAGLRFPDLVLRLGWGIPSLGQPRARLPGHRRNVPLLAEQSSFEPGPYLRCSEMGLHQARRESAGQPGQGPPPRRRGRAGQCSRKGLRGRGWAASCSSGPMWAHKGWSRPIR